MASTINASSTGSGGLITTGDASGQLALQANGVTQATVSSSGLTMATNQTISTANTYGFKNRLINGGMVIDQRNTGSAVTGTTSAFTADRWKAYNNTGGTLTFTQSSTVPNGNFTNSVVMTVTATGTPAEASINQVIEGYNIADLGFGTANAVTLTASFWIRSSVTGTYCFSLRQGSGSRSYVSPFTISTANTWQQVVVPIVGDTSGSYNTTNGSGFIYEICVGASTLQTSTTNAWQSGNYVCTSAQTNLQATNGATCYVTGCQLEVGSQATSFDFRSYPTELAMCQRYFETQPYVGSETLSGVGMVLASNRVLNDYALRVTKRAVPSSSIGVGSSTGVQNISAGSWYGASSVGFSSNYNYIRLDTNYAAGYFTVGNAAEMRIESGTAIWISAEL